MENYAAEVKVAFIDEFTDEASNFLSSKQEAADFMDFLERFGRTQQKQLENYELELKNEFADWYFIEPIIKQFVYYSKEKCFILCRLLGFVNMKQLQKTFYFRIKLDCFNCFKL